MAGLSRVHVFPYLHKLASLDVLLADILIPLYVEHRDKVENPCFQEVLELRRGGGC
jgi:hypothetical protein